MCVPFLDFLQFMLDIRNGVIKLDAHGEGFTVRTHISIGEHNVHLVVWGNIDGYSVSECSVIVKCLAVVFHLDSINRE